MAFPDPDSFEAHRARLLRAAALTAIATAIFVAMILLVEP